MPLVEVQLPEDPGVLTHEQRLALLTEVEAARAALDALQVRTLADLQAADTSEKEWVREEVACALTVAPVTAAARLHDAVDLVGRFPATVAQLAAGAISLAHARALLDHTRGLAGDVAAAVEARVLPRAAGRTVAQFRQSVRRAVASLDRRRQEELHRAAVAERRVAYTPREDGTAEIWALLPADAASRLMAVLNDCAATSRGQDERTADQRRADALADLAALATAAPAGRSAGPRIQVTVPVSTLLGVDDAPGELAGHGPVPAAMARALAADPSGTWQRLLVDPAGRLMEVSRAYTPPATLREHVLARDRTCRFPGCRRQARSCELDHVVPWPDGPTTADNLHALCRRHHHLKHEAGWAVARAPDGSTRWTSPAGAHYLVEPEPYDTGPPDAARAARAGSAAA